MKPSTLATKMIRDDHAAVMTQFHKITSDLPDDVLKTRARAICAALEVHAQLEEEIFYPALRAAGVQSAALDKSVPEHDTMRQLIEQVRAEEHSAAQWTRDALNELINAVMHHVADEETQLLPAAERFLGPQRLAELGAEMRTRRLALMAPRAAELGQLMSAAPAKTAAITVAAVVGSVMLLTRLRHRSPAAGRLA
jgi:hemerythrin superfamily protein